MTCAQCGITIMNAEGDTEGYFTLNNVTPTEDNDWDFCSGACLKVFVDEAME